MQQFEELYAEHYEAVRAYVRRRAPESVVDDVVADTFLVCLRKIVQVPDEPLPWLYAVARKTLANHRRRLARQAPAAAALATAEPWWRGRGCRCATPPSCSAAPASRAPSGSIARRRGWPSGSNALRRFDPNPKE